MPRDQVPLFQEDGGLIEALGALRESELGRGLVVDGEVLVGLLSITDIARALEVGATRRTGRLRRDACSRHPGMPALAVSSSARIDAARSRARIRQRIARPPSPNAEAERSPIRSRVTSAAG